MYLKQINYVILLGNFIKEKSLFSIGLSQSQRVYIYEGVVFLYPLQRFRMFPLPTRAKYASIPIYLCVRFKGIIFSSNILRNVASLHFQFSAILLFPLQKSPQSQPIIIINPSFPSNIH